MYDIVNLLDAINKTLESDDVNDAYECADILGNMVCSLDEYNAFFKIIETLINKLEQ